MEKEGEKKKVTNLPLRNMPEDVKKIVRRIQGELKAKKGTSQFSLPSTIYQIIKEYDKLIKTTNA